MRESGSPSRMASSKLPVVLLASGDANGNDDQIGQDSEWDSAADFRPCMCSLS